MKSFLRNRGSCVLLMLAAVGYSAQVASATTICGSCPTGLDWVATCRAQVPAAGQEDLLDTTRVEVLIDTNMDGISDTTVLMSGPMRVLRKQGPAGTMVTEILSMKLSGEGMTLRAGSQIAGLQQPILATTGEIGVSGGPPDYFAQSFFDVFFELDRGEGPNRYLYNHAPLKVQASITCAPPKATFAGLVLVPLFTAPSGGTPAGQQIYRAYHSTFLEEVGFCTLNVEGKGKICLTNTSAINCQTMGGTWNLTTCIPTVSQWGLVVMAMLVLTAATVVIMRRRAMVRGGL